MFARRDRAADHLAAYEQQVEELYAEIGRLTTQVAWLKKKSDLVLAGEAAGHGRAR